MAENSSDYLSSLRLAFAHLGQDRWRLVLAIGLACISALGELFPYWVIYRLVEAVVAGTADAALFWRYGVILVIAIPLTYLIFGAATRSSHIAAFGMIRRLRYDLARRLGRLSLGQLGARRSGEYRRLIIDNPEKLELLVAHAIPEGTSALAAWIGTTIWLFIVDWRLALAAAILTPVATICIGVAMSKAAPETRAMMKSHEDMGGTLTEYLAGIQVMKMFNRDGDVHAKARNTIDHVAKIQSNMGRAYLPFGGTFYGLINASITIILPVGVWLMVAGEITLPVLLFFVIVGANYATPLVKLFDLFHSFAEISVTGENLQNLVDTPPQADTGTQFPDGSTITFDAVDFAYDDAKVLDDVSFTAHAGQVTALVGPSGAGKSTAAMLIPRFHDVTGGRITLGGVDLRDMSVETLMDQIAFVFQDTFLFSDTIAANLRFGDPDADMDAVIAAARAAQAHEFIAALPDGYDTIIGDGGAQLSGGERQRIAIARAILKNAPVILLDEATAFADPDSEAAIQTALAALAQGKTLIVIAHRLHTIQGADQIVVLDQGHVAEHGRHEDLIAQGGLYARLWEDYHAARSMTLATPTQEGA